MPLSEKGAQSMKEYTSAQWQDLANFAAAALFLAAVDPALIQIDRIACERLIKEAQGYGIEADEDRALDVAKGMAIGARAVYGG
jgi:hypothetical protein